MEEVLSIIEQEDIGSGVKAETFPVYMHEMLKFSDAHISDSLLSVNIYEPTLRRLCSVGICLGHDLDSAIFMAAGHIHSLHEEQGVSLTALATRFGFHRDTLREVLYKLGFPTHNYGFSCDWTFHSIQEGEFIERNVRFDSNTERVLALYFQRRLLLDCIEGVDLHVPINSAHPRATVDFVLHVLREEGGFDCYFLEFHGVCIPNMLSDGSKESMQVCRAREEARKRSLLGDSINELSYIYASNLRELYAKVAQIPQLQQFVGSEEEFIMEMRALYQEVAQRDAKEIATPYRINYTPLTCVSTRQALEV